MYGEIMQAVKALALAHASPFARIENGLLPKENGISIAMGPSNPNERHLDRGGIHTMQLVLNGKHKDQSIVVGALSCIHTSLTRMREYPSTNDWQITSIESNPGPNFIEQEPSTKQWLYGSVLAVGFYMKGVEA
ncbi:hypothetical protein LJC60_01105 [Ruminococcaceae bacterium OttesenSCG-928-D13]|nr:hypothetical protein [Ruminococcaceae bacterium OttesenSCG-928-D13]